MQVRVLVGLLVPSRHGHDVLFIGGKLGGGIGGCGGGSSGGAGGGVQVPGGMSGGGEEHGRSPP